MNQNTLVDTGMRCLIETLGPVEAERFIATILRESFDYTQWRKTNLCPNMPLEEIHNAAKQNWEKKQSASV